MKWLKRILIALAVLLAIAAALPFFISLDDYIPRIEEAASARLKEPVSIKSIRFAALPLPHVTVDGITLGKSGDIRLGKITVTPDLFSLLQSTRVLRSIEIASLVLMPGALDKISAWAKSSPPAAPQESPPVRVERIRVDNVVVNFAQGSFGPFDARVRLKGNNEPEDMSIASQDGKLKASIKPDGSTYRIDAMAKSWTLPVGPALLFDELIIKGVATQNDANLGELSAKLYGGTVIGKAKIDWRKGLRLDGDLDVGGLELRQVASMLSPGTHVSGKLTAKPVFSAAAASADQLMKALRLETPFNIQQGTLHGVDIRKAATNLIKQGTSGGETRFEHLSGHLLVERGSQHFTQLRIASGVLAADGKLSVSPKKELSGRINAQVKAVGTSASVPLNVGGTVGSPLLYPTGASVAGAAVGTAILGPGLGTSVGARVGGWAESLFDKKEKQ